MRRIYGGSAAVLLSMAVVASTSRVTAQALPTATGPESTLQVGGGFSGYHIDYGRRWLGGTSAWIDYKPLIHFGIEGEARSLRYNQDLGVHGSTFLAGPRVVLHRGAAEPYFKVLAGTGRLTFPFEYAHGNYFVVAGGGGIDLRLGSRISVRVIDVSYQRWPRFSFGTITSYGASAGINLVLRRGETWRSDSH